MFIESVNKDKQEIIVKIPLTTTSGKTRVKQRDNIFGYGLPFASRTNKFNQKNYIEWQIGYDAKVPKDIVDFKKEKYKNYCLTTIKDYYFVGYNESIKTIYELSEYLHYFHLWGVVNNVDLINLCEYLDNLPKDELLDNHKQCQIKRTHPKETNINDIDFYTSIIEYPQLIHKFGEYEIIAEITIREKQRAIGTQPMLYFCFPINELQANTPLIGRIAEKKEHANFIFNKDNCFIILKMIKIFGMLSTAHRFDIIKILKTIIKQHKI
jgi:hypothetical protein